MHRTGVHEMPYGLSNIGSALARSRDERQMDTSLFSTKFKRFPAGQKPSKVSGTQTELKG